MFDVSSVQRIAAHNEFHETVVWLDEADNRDIYAEGMFRGFEPAEESNGS